MHENINLFPQQSNNYQRKIKDWLSRNSPFFLVSPCHFKLCQFNHLQIKYYNMKKIFIFSVLSILTFTSCQKEIKSLDKNPLQSVQKETNATGLKTNAINYRASVEKTFPLVFAKRKTAMQNIENLTLERMNYLRRPEVMSSVNSSKKSVIHVPQDYSTLQAAVDNSIDGGKIIVDGTVLQSGNVMVDVPNLTIQGEGEEDEESSTINDNSNTGDNLVVTVPGVTIKNLKLLDIGIVVNSTTSAKLMNLNARNSNPLILSVIGLFGSTNSVIKNCVITYSILGADGVTGIGVFLDDFSNNNEVVNCKVSNTQFTAFDIEGSDNSINNCEAVDFYRGFISFDGVSTGNVFTGCVANHSYADAGFVFLNFSPNNTTVTLKNCTANDNIFASIVDFGGSVIISNCTTSSITRNIFGPNPVGLGILVIGGFQTGEFATVSNCTANSNGGGGIGIVNINFEVTNNTCNNSLGVEQANGIVLFNDSGLPMSGTVKGNTTDFNANNSIGINLIGVTNSSIINNRSMNNGVCDFNQTNCSGNTLTNNKFGSSCTGL
ncbi:hypothetical protein BH10BAC3_BH10BAC3_14450 [soil metagenome]